MGKDSASLRPNIWRHTVRGRGEVYAVCHWEDSDATYKALSTPDERSAGAGNRTAVRYQDLGMIASRESARARARRLYGYAKFGN